MKLIIDIPAEKDFIDKALWRGVDAFDIDDLVIVLDAIAHGTPLTSQVLADELMEERIRGELNTDTTFEKYVIPDVKCRLEVSIIDRRPCHCGAELREVWRESEET